MNNSQTTIKESICVKVLWLVQKKESHSVVWAPLSMEFSRQEYWSGLSFPSPGDLSNPGIEPGSPSLQAESSTISIKRLLQGLPLNVFAQMKSIHLYWGRAVGVPKTNTTSFHQSLPQCNRITGWKSLSRVQLFETPGTIQSIGFFRPEYWSEWPFPSPGDLPNPGIEPRSLVLQADSLPS